MQPYFLPYIGYFQLIAAVDRFVLYDNIKYTKKGWINRNRMLRNGSPAVFTLPLKHAPDGLDIRDRELARDFHAETLLAQIRGAYLRAPNFESTFALLEQAVLCDQRNLFGFIERSVKILSEYLGLKTPIRRSSEVPADHTLHGQERVLAICDAEGGSVYVNPIGGTKLYSVDTFAARGVELRFLSSDPLVYPQFGGDFVPSLSILDVLMFNPLSQVREFVRTGFRMI